MATNSQEIAELREQLRAANAKINGLRKQLKSAEKQTTLLDHIALQAMSRMSDLEAQVAAGKLTRAQLQTKLNQSERALGHVAQVGVTPAQVLGNTTTTQLNQAKNLAHKEHAEHIKSAACLAGLFAAGKQAAEAGTAPANPFAPTNIFNFDPSLGG